jgi:hypothetical protein
MYLKLLFGFAALLAFFLAGCSTAESRIQSPALWLTLTSGPGACPPGANQARYVESIVSYEVPYKIAYFEGDRCTGWEYLTR